MLPEKIDRYEIERELGRGGMATVYLARDPRFEREVAVKVLPREFLHEPTFRERFDREATVIAALEHPAIVPVYDFGEQDGQPYLVMRYMSGGSLAERLRRGPLPLQEAAEIIARLAPALDRAHAMGVIHRDLKPQNILFDRFGNAFISDFGSAHIAQASTSLTGDTIVGTPAYMSPEQARGDVELDGRSDIYALGAILFEMLTGEQPYEADTPMGVAVKHITEPVPRILDVKSDLPPELEAIISRAMAKKRADRYLTAEDLAADLNAVARVREGDRGSRATPVTRQDLRPVSPPLSHASGIHNPHLQPDEGAAVPTPARGWLGLPRWVWFVAAGVVLAGICGVIVISGGTLAILAGQSNPLATSLPAGPETTRPPATLSQADNVLFEDDFSSTESGWDRFEDELSLTDYDGGGYRIQVNKDNAYYWANPGRSFSDVIIDVDATKISGPDDNEFGVICRYQNGDNFYLFVTSSDGYYSINKYVDGEFSIVGRESYAQSDVIHQGEATNHLQAACVGDRLQLTVNGQLLAEFQDPELRSGDVGLIAGTFDEPGTDILFDNFVVTRP